MDVIGLRPREAAQLLGVSQRTLFTWTKCGAVPHAKIGRIVIYDREQLREWLAAQTGQRSLAPDRS